MFYEVMMHVRKNFENCWVDSVHTDRFKIEDGAIDLPFLVNGQYFMIVNSFLNDGVYVYGSDILEDEDSEFTVYSIKPPKPFVELVNDIKEWYEKYSDKVNKPFTSESFDGYSYTKSAGADGMGLTWKDVFRDRLNVWRMIG